MVNINYNLVEIIIIACEVLWSGECVNWDERLFRKPSDDLRNQDKNQP